MEDAIKKCPYCAEEIKLDAIKCKHCGELLNTTNEVKEESKISSNSIKPSTILSMGLLISFFLPWFSVPFFDISGFSIPTSIDKFISMGSFVGEDMTILKLSYLIYLIPLTSLYNIIVDIGKVISKYFLNEFAIGLFCSLTIYFLLKSYNNDLTRTLGIGFYLTILISVIGLILTNPLFKKLTAKE